MTPSSRNRLAPATLAALQNDRTLIADLVTWTRAGFAPRNTNLHNTASDGTDIGAVAFSGAGTATA